MAIKNTNVYYCQTFQNLPKLGFFGSKIYHLATLEFIGSVNFSVNPRQVNRMRPKNLHTFFSRAQSYKTFLGATKLRKGKFSNPSGVDVMATIFCDFLPIFVEKMAFFSKKVKKML
jgi:hypothetical protein